MTAMNGTGQIVEWGLFYAYMFILFLAIGTFLVRLWSRRHSGLAFRVAHWLIFFVILLLAVWRMLSLDR